MLNMMKAGALALAMTGFVAGGVLPAEAATYFHASPAPGVSVTIGSGYGSWWWRHHHPRHRVLVCETIWRHHHKVRVCTWEWRWRPFPYARPYMGPYMGPRY